LILRNVTEMKHFLLSINPRLNKHPHNMMTTHLPIKFNHENGDL